MSREEVLRVAADGEQEPFINLIRLHERKDHDFNIFETVESLSNKQLEELWTSLNHMCTTSLLGFSVGDDDEGQEELKTAEQVVHGVVLMAQATIQQKEFVVPLSLLETVVVLHGVLLSIPDDMVKLHTSIGRLCEYWWTHNLHGREAIAINTITYFLEKSLLAKSPIADIKRVWSLRDCLKELQLDNESSNRLKSLLQDAFASAKYLKNDEGRRFLSFLFGLSVNFIDSIHITIKNQIPYCSTSLLPLYGEVYYRAWRDASDETLEKIELKCLQDLMYRAIHAMRGTANSMASRLRKLLGYIHKEKKQQRVGAMLLKLYEPFLWRSLKVANGLVRANAVNILEDVFPLGSGEGNEETDNLLQKQFDILLILLDDPAVVVRASTVRAVCNILCIFWESIPSEMIQTFLLKLLQDLAWDAASADVRTAVLTGLSVILDNHLSHQKLKNVLPEMRNLLHDNSEMVRVAFIEILLRVKRIKIFKTWSIAPMEHLLARLEVDDAPVCRRIVKLIFNSYVPIEKPPETQLHRVVHLIQTNKGAARKFFKYAQIHMSPSSIAVYMIMICRYILQLVRKDSSNSTDSTTDSQEDTDEDKQNEDDENTVTAKDVALMSGLLEVIIILWEGSGKIFKGSDNNLKKKLEQTFSVALPEMFKYFQDREVCASLILLAGYLPPKTIPTFSRTLLSKLKGMDIESTPEIYGPLIESMCKWQKLADLLELVSDWFEATIVIDQPESNNKANTSRRRGVTFDAPVEAKPQLGVAYIRYLTSHAICREALLTYDRDNLITVLTLLRDLIKCIDARISSGVAEEILSDELIVDLFEEYLRLEILLHKPKSAENAVESIRDIVKWASQNLLPLLRQRKQNKRRLLTQTETTMSSQEGTMMGETMAPTLSTTLLSTTLKRGAGGDAVEYTTSDLATQLIKRILTVSADMCLVGIGSYTLSSQLSEFTVNLLGTEDSVRLLPEIANLMYQITEFMLSRQSRAKSSIGQQRNGEDADSDSEEIEQFFHSDMVPDMLKKVLSMLAHLVRVKRELAERVLPSLKPALTEMIFSYYQHQSLNQTLCRDVMSTIMAGVVGEMTMAIKKDNFLDRMEGIPALPLLSAFVLGIICKRSSISSIFHDELSKCVDSGAVETLEGIVGVLHLLYTLNKNKSSRTDMKECLTVVQKQFEDLDSPEDEDTDSPYSQLHNTAKGLLKDVMTEVGMVA